MSGFEIAGLVLGAFPIALEALNQYEVVKAQIKLWRRIQEAYVECKDDLIFQQLLFEDNLLDLLSMATIDEKKIELLISNPDGECWKDESLTDLLEQEHYEPYRRCINAMERTMKELNHELGLDAEYVQQKLGSSIRHSRLSSIRYQLWRVHFTTGGKVSRRQKLVEQLKSHNEKLAKLLTMSKKKRERQATRHPTIDSTLCNFWVSAGRLFKALSHVWCCSCSDGQHSAKLLLQQRLNNEPDFNIVFAKNSSSRWEIRKTRISEQREPGSQVIRSASTNVPETTTHQPKHRDARPSKSSMKSSAKSASTSLLIQKSLSLIVTTPNYSAEYDPVGVISNLCSSLNTENDCYGYFREEEYRYYVYRANKHNTDRFCLSTLDEVLRQLDRRQRYSLALTLASSFIQLRETPWLSKPWTKSDIVFINSPEDSNRFLLSQPHLHHDPRTAADNRQGTSDHQSNSRNPLVDLGVLLLELCFGTTLEDRLNADNRDRFMAALDWQEKVNDETGLDYSNAVLWCLVGYRSIQPEKWRQVMFQTVVKPLEKTCQHLLI